MAGPCERCGCTDFDEWYDCIHMEKHLRDDTRRDLARELGNDLDDQMLLHGPEQTFRWFKEKLREIAGEGLLPAKIEEAVNAKLREVRDVLKTLHNSAWDDGTVDALFEKDGRFEVEE